MRWPAAAKFKICDETLGLLSKASEDIRKAEMRQ